MASGRTHHAQPVQTCHWKKKNTQMPHQPSLQDPGVKGTPTGTRKAPPPGHSRPEAEKAGARGKVSTHSSYPPASVPVLGRCLLGIIAIQHLSVPLTYSLGSIFSQDTVTGNRGHAQIANPRGKLTPLFWRSGLSEHGHVSQQRYHRLAMYLWMSV